MNWFYRPPLTSSYPSDSNKQFANSRACWTGGLGAGEFCTVACALYTEGGFELGSRETILEEEGRERAVVRGGVECGSSNSLFLSPSPEAELQASNCGPLGIPGTFSGSRLEAFEKPCEDPLGCWLLGPSADMRSCSGGATD